SGQTLPGDGGVGGDDAGQPQFQGQVGDGVHVVVVQIRRDLDQDGDGGDVPHRHEDGPEGLHGLQVTQPRRVGGADVDHQVVGEPGEHRRGRHVVAHRVVCGHDLGLTDVDPHGVAAAPAPQVVGGVAGPVVVEPHAVEDRAV